MTNQPPWGLQDQPTPPDQPQPTQPGPQQPRGQQWQPQPGQAPPWGQPWQPGGPQYQQPYPGGPVKLPRKRHRVRTALLSVVGALVALVAISAALSSNGSHNSRPSNSVVTQVSPSATASSAAPATTPAATTPYHDGWEAATKATYIDLNVANSNDQNGGNTFTPHSTFAVMPLRPPRPGGGR